ncbi:MAG: FkbM family methyltransferase [Gemmatimonadetes bacterium]|nr:FkbM family methyltransferase [Gemmatimonadota bacterium]
MNLTGQLRQLRLIRLDCLHQVWEVEHLKKVFETFDVDCVFDVGANYGQYAEMLRKKVGYRGLIVSFEPIPDAVDHLRKLAARDPRWRVEQVALSNTSGEQAFNIMAESQFSSLSSPRHDETVLFRDKNTIRNSIPVKTETLSRAYARLRAELGFIRPFLKLDTQGYDVEIVRSGAEVLPDFIGLQSELAVRKLYEHSVDFVEALAEYRSHGFTLTAFVPNNGGHFPQLIETDCIMLRSDLVLEG